MIDMKASEIAALQADLILEAPRAHAPVVPMLTLTKPMTQERLSAPRPRRRSGSLYDLVGQTVATCFGLVVNAVLWWFGAAFTLLWLGIDPKPTTWAHLAWYAIPLGVTFTESHFWPNRERTKTEIFLWFLVLGVDVWATFAGFREWGAGRELGGGMTLPKEGILLSLIGAVVGIVLAIGPEKMARSLGTRLIGIFKTMYRRWGLTS